ncbi:hypothetical protein TNCV_953791 [Trichonephila clavipes]|nr:hypothetical protein TNCV_953791 [Trichonephila clavipes]
MTEFEDKNSLKFRIPWASLTASLCYRIVDLLLRPTRKEKWGSPKKAIHFYSPLVHWANHVPFSGSLPMLTSKGTRWPILLPMKNTLEPLTSSTTVFDVNAKEFLDLLKSEKNAAKCRAKNSYNIADCIILRKAQAKLKNGIILSNRTTYRSFAANLDFRKYVRRAHSFISRLNNEKSSQHWEPITINGKLLTRPTEVATAFNKNYAAISRLHITALNRKSIYDKGSAPSPTEQGFLLLTFPAMSCFLRPIL